MREDTRGWDATFFEELAGVGVDGGEGGDVGWCWVGLCFGGLGHCSVFAVK